MVSKETLEISYTNDMDCRFCPHVPNETIEIPDETQEYIEICERTQNERRGLDVMLARNPKEIKRSKKAKIKSLFLGVSLRVAAALEVH